MEANRLWYGMAIGGAFSLLLGMITGHLTFWLPAGVATGAAITIILGHRNSSR